MQCALSHSTAFVKHKELFIYKIACLRECKELIYSVKNRHIEGQG